MRRVPPARPVTELVKLAMNLDEGRRGDIVEVTPDRAAQLYKARAATPAVEAPTAPPPAPLAAHGTADTDDGGDGDGQDESSVQAADGPAGEQPRVAARSGETRPQRDAAEGAA